MYIKPSMKMKLFIMSISAIVLGAMLIPTTTSAATIEELLAQIQVLQVQLLQLQATQGVIPATACTFNKNLYPGVNDAQVKCLQQYLNATGYTVALSGAGSVGSETNYYGPLTKAAVTKWQNANSVAYGAYPGYFGPISQTKYTAIARTTGGTVITPTPIVTPVTVNNAKLTSNNPASASITKNASNFKLLDVKFDGNGIINSLSVKRIGFSSDGDFNGIYLYKDGVRLADKKYFGNNSTVTFSNLNLQAPFVLAVMSDFNATGGKIAKVELSGDYPGLPLSSNDFTLVDISSGKITIEKGSAIASDSVVVGQRNALISEFKITDVILQGNTATTTEAVSIKHLELYNAGHNVLSNIKLTDGTTNWFGTINGNKLVFDLDYFLKAGRSKTFKVYADVDGRVNDQIKLQIQNDYDVIAIGDSYKFGVTIDRSSFNSVNNQDLSLRDIGKLSVQSKSTDDVIGYWGQSLSDVAKFRFTAEKSEGFFIDTLRFANSVATSTDKFSITYKTKSGSSITKTETIDLNEEVVFDSFSTSDRPYVAKDSNMDISVSLTLRNDEDSIRLREAQPIVLHSYSATGESSDEEIIDKVVNETMKDTITSNAATVSFSKNGNITLDPNDDIDFSVIFNSDDRDSAFLSATTTNYIKAIFRLSTTSESMLSDVKATIKVNNNEVATTILIANVDNAIEFNPVKSGDTELVFSDGEKMTINISFDGLIYFDTEYKDRLTVTFANDNDTIKWIDNYDSSDNATSELIGNVKDMTTGLSLKFNFKN